MRAVDGLRAVAVLAVVAHHASLLPWAIGARGVGLFFVISGFCLSLPTLTRAARGLPPAFDRRRFALGRVARIVPPYYAALALFGLLSLTSFGVPSVLAPPHPNEWLEDALFLTSRAPAYNASFWTLGVEARWYVLFPMILTLYLTSKRWFAVVGIASYALYAWQDFVVDFGTLPAFMSGLVAADLYVRGRANSKFYPFAAAAALALAIAVDRGENQGDPLWHLASFLIVVAGVGRLSHIASFRPLVFVGVASYSIYLVHQPLLIWVHGFVPNVALCGALSVLAGIAFWRFVEVPSLAIADRIRGVAPAAA